MFVISGPERTTGWWPHMYQVKFVMLAVRARVGPKRIHFAWATAKARLLISAYRRSFSRDAHSSLKFSSGWETFKNSATTRRRLEPPQRCIPRAATSQSFHFFYLLKRKFLPAGSRLQRANLHRVWTMFYFENNEMNSVWNNHAFSLFQCENDISLLFRYLFVVSSFTIISLFHYSTFERNIRMNFHLDNNLKYYFLIFVFRRYRHRFRFNIILDHLSLLSRDWHN